MNEQPKKKKILTIIIGVLLVIILILIGLSISLQLQTKDNTSPGQSEASGSCVEECPTSDRTRLKSCNPPESDGTPAESLCGDSARKEVCGGKTFCCSGAGGKWSECANTPPPATTPTPGPTAAPVAEVPSTVIYAPSDYDKSAKVDINDFKLFVGYYSEGDSLSDLDKSGKIGIDDFIVFRKAYLADNQ